jgi:hypothetical protein
VPRIRVTHTATGRTLIGNPDELLEWLPTWWPGPFDDEVHSHLTQAVYAWEQGRFTDAEGLGLRAEPA